jgi:hypothetical protein
VLENPAARVALVAPENPAVRVVRVALAVPENLAAPAVRAALAALENPVVRAVQVAPAVLENPAVQVALENRVVPAALVKQVLAALARQVVAALLRQVEVPEKEAQTRSAGISRRQAVVAVAPSLAAVGALLKPRAAGVAAA